MGSAAGLDVDAFDVDDSDGISGDDTALIEVETVFGLGFFLALEVFVYGVGL